MNRPSLIDGNLNPVTTIDFTAGLGYGLIFQPILGSRATADNPRGKPFFFIRRRRSRKQIVTHKFRF